MKVAILTTENRENFKEYHKTQPYFGTAPEALLQGMARLPELEVHVVSCIQQSMSSPEKIAPTIWFHGLVVPKLGWLRTGYQGCIRAVRKKLRAIQPDIVHGQGTERDCAISAVLSGFPNVLTVHGNMRLISRVNRARPFSFEWLAARLETFILPRTRGVVCITHYTQEAVSDLVKKTWVVPNAVDATFFDIRPAPALPRTILCVGNVMPRKNQNAFIRALDQMAASISFQLLFLGGAPETDPYAREFFSLLKTRPWCAYGGFADRAKLKQHLAQATLLALPSLEDNCPMVVLEAMAASVPVLAAKVGGLPDLIEDEVNGLFCDPLNAASLSGGVQRLLENPSLAEKLARRAREMAVGRYHPEVIARKHLEIYREVLNPNSETGIGTS